MSRGRLSWLLRLSARACQGEPRARSKKIAPVHGVSPESEICVYATAVMLSPQVAAWQTKKFRIDKWESRVAILARIADRAQVLVGEDKRLVRNGCEGKVRYKLGR